MPSVSLVAGDGRGGLMLGVSLFLGWHGTLPWVSGCGLQDLLGLFVSLSTSHRGHGCPHCSEAPVLLLFPLKTAAHFQEEDGCVCVFSWVGVPVPLFSTHNEDGLRTLPIFRASTWWRSCRSSWQAGAGLSWGLLGASLPVLGASCSQAAHTRPLDTMRHF